MKVARLFERTLGWEFLIRQFGFFFPLLASCAPHFNIRRQAYRKLLSILKKTRYVFLGI